VIGYIVTVVCYRLLHSTCRPQHLNSLALSVAGLDVGRVHTSFGDKEKVAVYPVNEHVKHDRDSETRARSLVARTDNGFRTP